MKPKAIQRGIESPHAREMGPVPLRHKISKVRDTDSGDGSQWVGDSPLQLAHRRRMLMIWSALLSLTTLVVVGGFMMFWLRTHGAIKYIPNSQFTDAQVRIASKFVAPGQDEALEAVKQALAIRDPAQIESLIHPGGATPAEVVEFMAAAESRDGKLDSCTWLSSMDVEGLQMEGVLVTYAGKQPPVERLAFLTPDARGIWKVDFDAFARSSRPSWKDLLDGHVDRAQVRVFIAKDEYFNGPYDNDAHWVCYGMVSLESNALLPEGQQLLHGYCKVDSAQAKAMAEIFNNDIRVHRVTVELLRTQGADMRQFQITRVLGEDWVLPPKPFDERFD